MALVFPEDRTSYPGCLKFTLIGDDGVSASPNETGDSQVQLYLQQGMQVADKVEYDNAELGLVGGVIAGGARGSGSENDSMTDAFSADAANKMVEGLVAKAGASVGGGIGAGIRARTKKSPNPNTRALFKQVNLRTFQFSFKLIPTSEAEAVNIQQIIKFFRAEMYPESIEATVGGIELAIAYRFPKRIIVEMEYDGQSLSPKIAPSYIDSFTANYNGSSQTFFKGDGQYYFSEVDINFSLTESQALTRKQIEAGY